MTLGELCGRTALDGEDIRQLEELERQLPLIAQLTGADIFIDCFDVSCRTALVVAQARPDQPGSSAYAEDVRGKTALREMEPAVYRALENGLPTRELKAITQEGAAVRQDAAPIRNGRGRIIGVLIREKDVYSDIARQKKFDRLARERDELTLRSLAMEGDAGESDIRMREMHHRVKNNLQMIASIMNLQARRTESPEVRLAFAENTQRVLSIAAIHDMLSRDEQGGGVRLQPLLERICRDIQMISDGERAVTIEVGGEDLLVKPDTATSIALVVNELVTNALCHGYPDGRRGRIRVGVQPGPLYSVITVADDGAGYDTAQKHAGSLGLDIVMLTVKDKLRGDVHIASGSGGTVASFSFRMPD